MEKRSPREDPPRLPQSTDPPSALLQQEGHTDTSEDHIQGTKQPHPIGTTESEKHHTFEGIPHKEHGTTNTTKSHKEIAKQKDLTAAATAAATKKTQDQDDGSNDNATAAPPSTTRVDSSDEDSTTGTITTTTKNQQKQQRQQRRNIKPSGGGERLLPEDFEPTPYSVIIGRGKESRDHATGNHRLRVMVSELAEQYSNAKNRTVMSNIVSSIVSTVREASPCTPEGDVCGAFIRLSKEDGRWYEVSDAVAREKVGYTFRDMLGNRYRSSSKYKVARKRQLRGEAAVAAAAAAAAENMLIFAEGEEGHQETAAKQSQTNDNSNRSRATNISNETYFNSTALKSYFPAQGEREQEQKEPFSDNKKQPPPTSSWLQPMGIPSPGQQSEATLPFGPNPPILPAPQQGMADPFAAFLQQQEGASTPTGGTGHHEAGNEASSQSSISNIVSGSFSFGGRSHDPPPLTPQMPTTMPAGLGTQIPTPSSSLLFNYYQGTQQDINSTMNNSQLVYRHLNQADEILLPGGGGGGGSNDHRLPPQLPWPVQQQQQHTSLTHHSTTRLSSSSQRENVAMGNVSAQHAENDEATIAMLDEEEDDHDCRPS